MQKKKYFVCRGKMKILTEFTMPPRVSSNVRDDSGMCLYVYVFEGDKVCFTSLRIQKQTTFDAAGGLVY